MNEKSMKVLEQYELEIRNVRRGRGSLILDTSRGLLLLKEYNGSQLRGRWIKQVCQKVLDAGMEADCPIENKDGEYVSTDWDEKRYLLKQWVNGREIDVKNIEEIKAAVKHLAYLHKALRGMEHGFCKEESLEDIFEKRIRELRRIYRYIREKKGKNAFEALFMKEYDAVLEKCLKAQELSGQEGIVNLQKTAEYMGAVCHRDYNQHNVLMADKRIMAVNFENSRVGVQTEDLYVFMRKILEKNNWNLDLAKEMLRSYQMEYILSPWEIQDLYLRFSFEEKFWKIANHYYNSGKTWIPDRSMQKMEKLLSQARNRQRFLDYFKSQYLEM